MQYKINIGPVEICTIGFQLDENLINDSEKLSDKEIDIIIKDSLLQELRKGEDESFKQLLQIFNEAFNMHASIEFNKLHKGEFKEPTEEEIHKIYREFVENQLKLTPII